MPWIRYESTVTKSSSETYNIRQWGLHREQNKAYNGDPLSKGKTMNKKLVKIAVAAVVAGAVTGICQAAYDAKDNETDQEK